MKMIYQFQTTAPDAMTAVEQARQAMAEMLKAYPDSELDGMAQLEVIAKTDLVETTFRYTQKFDLP